MDLPQVDELEAEASLVGQAKKMELLPQLSPNLQESFDQAEQKDSLSQDVRPYFGKLEQGESFVCPPAIQESGEQVEGLILYQTVEEETQMEKTTEDIVEAAGSPENSIETAPVCLSEEVEEITERQMDHEPFMHVSLIEMTEKTAQHLDAKATVMELDSIYSGYARHSSPAASTMTPDEGTSKSMEGVQTGVSVGQEAYESVGEDEDLLPGIITRKNRTLLHDHSSNDDDLPQQHETAMAPASPADTQSSHPNVFLPSDSDCGNKPQELQLPVKTEETKRESVEDIYPDSSDVKQVDFLSAVKAEDVVPKDEQLDYPIKPETLETKSELLSISVKPEGFERKADVYSAFSAGGKLKTETKPEDLEFTTYPDSSEEKCKAKAEPLEFTLPDVKGKIKQELLEADSTVLTPKLEQSEGLVDAAASLVVKGQLKKLCSPGNNCVLASPCKFLTWFLPKGVCVFETAGRLIAMVLVVLVGWFVDASQFKGRTQTSALVWVLHLQADRSVLLGLPDFVPQELTFVFAVPIRSLCQ